MTKEVFALVIGVLADRLSSESENRFSRSVDTVSTAKAGCSCGLLRQLGCTLILYPLKCVVCSYCETLTITGVSG